LTTLGIVGWVVALIGVYGVVAYVVAQRTREFGVRMALGATRSDIRRMVQRDALRMMLLGAVPGLVVAFAASFLLRSVLFGVDHYDPVSFGLVPLVMLGVGLLATDAPARRAARVDPNVTLRQS
jgi:ABC-type antimicrobial peptide transport system permease subunit